MDEVKLFEDLDEAGRDAAGALDRSARPRLFERLDWFRLVRDHMEDGKPLVIRAAGHGGRAWLFLVRDGASARSLTNWYSLRFGPVVETLNGTALRLDGLADGL